jgi:hypothetical protein
MNSLQPWLETVIHERLGQAAINYKKFVSPAGRLDIRVGKGKAVQVVAVSIRSVILHTAKLTAS